MVAAAAACSKAEAAERRAESIADPPNEAARRSNPIAGPLAFLGVTRIVQRGRISAKSERYGRSALGM